MKTSWKVGVALAAVLVFSGSGQLKDLIGFEMRRLHSLGRMSSILCGKTPVGSRTIRQNNML